MLQGSSLTLLSNTVSSPSSHLVLFPLSPVPFPFLIPSLQSLSSSALLPSHFLPSLYSPPPLTSDDVSFEPKVDESERLRCLSAAITCAVLAPAGPQRSRILATLYKDERASQSLPTDFAILEKMHFLRLLRPREVSEFAKSLAPHQLAVLPGEGGSQVFSLYPDFIMFTLFLSFFYLGCCFVHAACGVFGMGSHHDSFSSFSRYPLSFFIVS
jgi:hypothetical protein